MRRYKNERGRRVFPGLTRAVEALTRILGRIAVAFEKFVQDPPQSLAERSSGADLRMSIVEESALNGGGAMGHLAIAMSNVQAWKFGLIPSLTDKDGVPLKHNGAPVTQEQIQVGWSSSDENVANTSSIAADGRAGAVKSGNPGDPNAVGTARVRCAISYPDGSVVEHTIDFAVTNSAPMDPELTGEVVEESSLPPVEPPPTP